MTRNSQKFRRLIWPLICLLVIIAAGGCASSYHAKAAGAQHAYFSGDYGRAAELIDKVDPARRDKLLYVLDKGIILNAAGKYEESNRVLSQAEDLADALYAKSVSREVAATLWSEEARDYPGERHEIALIPVIKMINYIMLDEWDDALVEVRRLNTTVESVYGSEHQFDNAFSLYLSAITWEALGRINDAHIDYKKVARSKRDVPYVGYDLKSTSSRLGMPVTFPPKGSLAWTKSAGYRQSDGELVVIAATGRSPRFVSEWVSTGFFTVSMPRVVAYEPRIPYATVEANGRELGRTYPFYNVGDDILVALKERSKRSLIRKIVKLSVQTGLYTAGTILMESDDTREQLAGIALSILAMSMAATDKADERSWRTLPAEFQIGRFYVEPGSYRIEVAPEGAGSPLSYDVTIGKERPAVIFARFGDTSHIASRRGVMAPDAAMKAEERELLQRVRNDPKDGSLRLKLARARIEGGNYDIAPLVSQGIRLGGSRREGTELMVMALAVRGEYRNAAEWAEKGRKSGFGSKYAYYEKALGYMSGKESLPPISGEPKLMDSENIENAFNYYIAGLIDERSLDYKDATENFSKAYEYGLRGEEVMEKVVGNFKKTDDEFKDSAEGARVISDFAEGFVGNL